jgi:hypothetical protein
MRYYDPRASRVYCAPADGVPMRIWPTTVNN